MKKYVFSFIFMLCLLFSISYSANASTSSSIAYVEYMNETEGLYGSDVTIPSVTDTKQDGVNISTGDLSIKETDLYLPGKNGLDLEIVRSITSSEVEAKYRYLDRMTWANHDGFAYKYEDEDGNSKWFYFPSETVMLENAPETLYACDYCLSSYRYTAINSSIGRMHPYMSMYNCEWTHEGDEGYRLFTRVPGECVRTCTDDSKSSYLKTKYQVSGGGMFQQNQIFKTWRVNTPRLKRTLTETYSDDNGWEKYFYAEFYDGNAIYQFEWIIERDNDENIETSTVRMEESDYYTCVYDIADDSADHIFGEGNASNYFYFEDPYGVRFYFDKESQLFVAKADRYKNTIRYDDETKTYTDTFGRIITVNENGITLDDGTGTKQVVKYENEKIPYEADNTIQTLTPYKFHVKKYGVFGNESTAETTTYTMYQRERTLSSDFAVNYYIVDNIEYPTGAKTVYEYTQDTQSDPVRPVTYSIPDITRLNITKTYFQDGETISNIKEYTYPEDYDDTRRDDYEVIVKRTHDNAIDTYCFDERQLMQSQERTGEAKSIEYTYATQTSPLKINLSKPPIATITENYTGNKERVQSFDYDKRLRKTEQTAGTYSNSYTYSAKGLPLTITYKRDANTTVVTTNTLSTDGNSIIRSETKENDVLKQVKTFEYDTFGNVTKETVLSPDETESIVTTFSYTYNADGTWSVMQTLQGLYDADGNALPDITTVTNYDTFGNITSVTDAKGNTMSYTYDDRNRPLSETKPGNITTSYSYNPQTNTVIMTQPNGTKIKYEYDGFGRLEEVLIDSGSGYVKAVSYTYDAVSRLSTENEYRTYGANGACTESYHTTYTYDKFDRETKRTTKNKSNNLVYEKSTAYDLTSSTTRNITTETVTGDSNITPAVYSASYDLRGRLREEALLNDGAEYLKTIYTYDYRNNPIKVKDNHAIDNGLDYTVKYEYDYMNNVVKETDITGSFKTTEYDAFGRAVKIIDFGGTSYVNYEYDDAGRLIKTTHPADPHLGAEASQKNYYDANGNLIKVLTYTGGNGYQVVENEYDSLNRLTKAKTYPDLATNGDTSSLTPDITQYTYDSMDNVTSMSIGATNPSVITYGYNGLNQMTSKTDALNRAETYTYNLAGQMLTKTDRNGTTFTYSYNVWGNPLSINAVNGTTTDSVSYTYDILGNRLSMTDKFGTTTYTNDFMGRPVQESRNDFRGNISKQYTYDKFGNVTQSNINGQVTQNTYDNLDRLTAQTVGTLSSSFTYNTSNKLSSKVLNGITSSYGYTSQGYAQSLNIINANNQRYLNENYLYDIRSNIYDITVQTVDSYYNTTYSFDGKNRLTNENGIMTVYTYDSKDNRINKQGDFIPVTENKTFDLNNRDTSCTYDNNGNMTEDADGITYAYDLFNRMTERDAGIGAVHTYYYDGDNRRIRKQGITTDVYFIWDGMNLAEEKEYYLDDLQSTKKFIYGVDLSFCITDDDVWTYYTNIRGDIAGYVDSEGNMTEYKYDAWGNLLNPTEGDENPFRYAGEYFDEESGFIYLRNRYYDPTEGRFTTEDPIQDGLNWYVYCGNNPVVFVDPWGLDSYIFYLAEWEYEAHSDKQDLIDMGVAENEIHLIPLNSADDLINGWNMMGSIKDADGNKKTVSIDYVIINTHADPTSLTGQDEDGNWWYFDSEDIATLEDKNIAKNVLMYGCNAGHLDYKDSNPAANFAQKSSGAIVIASDGTVSMKTWDGYYKSKNDATFQYWRNAAVPYSDRANEGWIVYRHNGTDVTTRIADSGSKKLVVWGGCQLLY